MNKFLFRPTLLVLTLILLLSCASRKEIVIISTNDIHAAIDNFPSLATLVQDYRARYDNVLLVDAGDRWTGNPYVDLAEEPGQPIILLMNELGYDFGTFGNHEFDFGLELLEDRVRDTEFLNIVTNADFGKTPMRGMVESETVRNFGGIDLQIYGFITTAVNGHPEGKDESFGESEFWDALVMVRDLTKKPDAFTLILSHLGLEEDSLLAIRNPWIDLIVGGHSHDTIPVGRKINNTIVTQTGKSLGHAGITFVRQKGKGKYGIENSLVRLDTVRPDPRFAARVAEYKKNEFLDRQVGYAAGEFDRIAMMNLYSDIMRWGTGADISFYNMGSVRLHRMPEGPITMLDIFSAEPFQNQPVTMELTPAEIADVIIRKFNSTGKESHTLDIYPSGMEYTIITDGMGNATDVFIDRKGLPVKNKYVVAMSDYMNVAYDFPKARTGKPTGILITDVAVEYLGKNDPIEPVLTNRVKIE